MARKRQRDPSPKARLKKQMDATLKGVRMLSAASRPRRLDRGQDARDSTLSMAVTAVTSPRSPDVELLGHPVPHRAADTQTPPPIKPDGKRHARETFTRSAIAERVGDRHFKEDHRLLWDAVRDAFSGSHDSTDEFLAHLTAVGNGIPLPARTSVGPRKHTELLLHEAVLRQHERGFVRLCDYLSWLCEQLLPLVLLNPQEDFMARSTPLPWRSRITKKAVPVCQPDLPGVSLRRIREDRRDLLRLTRAVLKNGELRGCFLSLYFLYPKCRRSTRADKLSRRPLFEALNDLCLHWSTLREVFHRVEEVIAWEWRDFKDLRDEKLAHAVFKRVCLDFDQWSDQQGVDPTSVIRRLNRAIHILRLREACSRSR